MIPVLGVCEADRYAPVECSSPRWAKVGRQGADDRRDDGDRSNGMLTIDETMAVRPTGPLTLDERRAYDPVSATQAATEPL